MKMNMRGALRGNEEIGRGHWLVLEKKGVWNGDFCIGQIEDEEQRTIEDQSVYYGIYECPVFFV